jgi:hypothetical protein
MGDCCPRQPWPLSRGARSALLHPLPSLDGEAFLPGPGRTCEHVSSILQTSRANERHCRSMNERPGDVTSTLMRRLTLSGTKRFGDHHLRSYISSARTRSSYMTATTCRTSSSSCDNANTKLEPLLGPEMGLPVQHPLQRCRALGKSCRDLRSVLE